jgi:hypothetical protein
MTTVRLGRRAYAAAADWTAREKKHRRPSGHVDLERPRPTSLQSQGSYPVTGRNPALPLQKDEGTMRSTTLTAGFDPNFARQRTGYRHAARRGVAPNRRTHGGLQLVVCNAASSAPADRSAEQILARRESRRAPAADRVKPGASEAMARRVLIAIRVAMGLVFVACGLSGFIDVAPSPGASMQGGAMAVGGALLLCGSLLPLLKGTEVIVETILDLQRTLSTRRTP